ncbi:DUF262 domain-containing protein [Stutzerimonas kunmingensis]|uniref:DUF262 domain-containing protein n=1 Tax=Stutzerimonas kunmingensis TaxID=1211807 RepID=UPI0028A97CD1|nr:DUF262 domain-containing protein [Stutzerimonas kunmingensis]
MAFVEPITIKDAIDSVHQKHYLLPAIQREFVWDTYQIERLFDSLMRDYPISSFLFWQVDRQNTKNYQFYEFIRNYHERDQRHNPKADLSGGEGITAVLDGQQRLTSLYIGLKGSYAYKLPRKRRDNDQAYPKRKLCLNLVAPAPDGDLDFDFRFLTKAEQAKKDDDHFWFEVGEILDLSEAVDINDYLTDQNLMSLGREKFKWANRALFKLYEVIHKNKSINFFLEKDESLDKVLNIFIRVNSGGTQLSYSDLLLSIATAQWKEKDAREEITSFVEDINSIGSGFNANKDFVLKSCLVLGGFKDIAFKVDNFNSDNMLAIEKLWEDISKAIRASFMLVSSLGYHRDTLTSNNAIIPIATYLYSIGSPDNFDLSAKFKKDRDMIFKFLVITLLKRTFGGQPDNVLRPIRDVIKHADDGFPFEAIRSRLKGTQKSLSFDDDEISNILYYRYGQPYTYSALALIYPALDFRNKFHQDHIFPKKLFTRGRLTKKGIPASKIDFYLENFNCLANLQLLEGVPNQEKSAKDFQAWLCKEYPSQHEQELYKKRHFIPNVELTLDNFEEFISERSKLLTAAFEALIPT